MGIKVIAFDFGNVLVEDVEVRLENAYRLKLKPKTEQLRYEKYLDLVERGKGSPDKLMLIAKKVWKYPRAAAEIKKSIINARLIKPMWRLLRLLQKNYIVCILTNNKKQWPQKTMRHLGINAKGIKIFNSAYIGVRKPEAGAYIRVLSAFKIKPEQMLMIDDKQKNIAGAKKLGIKAVLYRGNFLKLVAGLKKQGIAVKI